MAQKRTASPADCENVSRKARQANASSTPANDRVSCTVTVSVASTFLRLPGELRNTIYRHVILAELEDLDRPLSGRHIRKTAYHKQRNNYRPVYPLHLVSRQVRGEFLSLRPVQTNARNIVSYIQTVYLRYTATLPAEINQYSGNLVINVENLQSAPTDVLPAVRLAAVAPSFHLGISCRYADAYHADALLQLNQSLQEDIETWKLISLGRIQRFEVNTYMRTIKVSIAGGIRNIMFWPKPKELFNQDTLLDRLRLPKYDANTGNSEGWRVEMIWLDATKDC